MMIIIIIMVVVFVVFAIANLICFKKKKFWFKKPCCWGKC